MTYYTNTFDRPAAAQNDDIDLMITISKLARTIHEMPRGHFHAPVVRAIRVAIAVAGGRLNHTDAETEVRAFCDCIIDPGLCRDDIDGLIADYIECAARMVEEGWE
jgi:hypothetical protein